MTKNKFAVSLALTVTGPDRRTHFQQVVDHFAQIESGDANLLDCAWSLSDEDDCADVEVEITVLADDERSAFLCASGSVRAAIHAGGGFTPGWDEPGPDLEAVVYRLRDEEVALV